MVAEVGRCGQRCAGRTSGGGAISRLEFVGYCGGGLDDL
jgi:hypothetical protein